MTLDLATLRAALEHMTRGAWFVVEYENDYGQPSAHVAYDDDASDNPHVLATLDSHDDGDRQNAAGIVALRNAAPALLKIAEAAVAWRAARAASQWSDDPEAGLTDAQYHTTCALIAALAALEAK